MRRFGLGGYEWIVDLGGREMRVYSSFWNGKEVIRIDGRPVSEKRSFGLWTRHAFEVPEGEQSVAYSVLVTPFASQVRKNGTPVAREAPLWFAPLGILGGLLTGAVLVAAVIATLTWLLG